MDQYVIFAPVLRSERLTMTLYDAKDDSQFIAELWNTVAGSVPPWTHELLCRFMKNTTLSPQNCLGLKPSHPSVYIIHLGSETGPSIGHINLSERHPDIPPDIGYAILPVYRRQGYAFEAAACVLSYWHHSLGLKAIVGFCHPANTISNKLIQKLGFIRGGQATVEEGNILVNAYVLPGMSVSSMTKETTRFGRMGTDKAE
ncbi:hypothetical protein IFR05_010265 [Cadophora sp. M221]|nr:hypothetical protein IFR05_010265 [Cadophora sp. M221]